MKAWQISSHGGLEALKLVELPRPEAGPYQARVKVEAVGLNHLDIWARKGVLGFKFPLPLVPGCDISGVIESFGPLSPEQTRSLQKDGLKVGSPVIINPGISCGRCEACLGGFDPLCRSYEMLGETMDGGLCEWITVPVTNLIPRPANITAAQGASLQIPFLTAWTMVQRKAQVKAGELVLIQAGGSGVSVAAIQICKMIGADVITTVGSLGKAAKAKALGADHVILYREVDFREQTKIICKSYGKTGCDVVVDHVGGRNLRELA